MHRVFWRIGSIAFIPLLLLSWQLVQLSQAYDGPAVDFKTQVRPILSNRCFACHGPDENTVESGLRLDVRDQAIQPADSGLSAIVPGDSADSELLRRIVSEDPDVRMPPTHFGERLSEREISILKQWIDSGAGYAKHWSFEAPALPTIAEPGPPELMFPHWQHSPIDRLVLAKLIERGWHPSAQADPVTLLRRVTLDLTGLPPTVEEQEAFLLDRSDDKYERLVDRLLASTAYGEHWGRRWLDMARYADSAGYADDPMRTIWAYRDWVIRAYNDNMPFDQFTIEQIAGDLLENATPEQLVATAFHRNTTTNNEGGTNDEEFRNVAIVDRVNTTMAVWMGLTMACAQCHSHKYDPLSQKDYFQVFAIFNQSEDADRPDESPVLTWYTPEQRALRERLQRELEATEQAIVAPDPMLAQEQSAWEEEFREPLTWNSVTPTQAVSRSGSALNVDDQGAIRASTPADSDTFTLEFPVRPSITADSIRAIRIRTTPKSDLPNAGAGFGDGNFVLTDASLSWVDTQASAPMGRFLRIELPGPNRILSLAEVQLSSGGENIALKGTASQSSESYSGAAARAIDGNTSGIYTNNSVTHTETTNDPWWEIDLGGEHRIESIAVWNRTDNEVGKRLEGAKMTLMTADRSASWQGNIDKAEAENRWSLLPMRSWAASRSRADFEQSGFEAAKAVDRDPKTGWAVGGSIDQSHAIKIAGSFPANEPQDLAASGGSLRLKLAFESDHKQAVLASFQIDVSNDMRADKMLAVPGDVLDRIRSSERTAQDEETIHKYFVSVVAPSREPLRQKRDALRRELENIKPTTTVPVMRELAAEKNRETRIQLRGNYRVTGDVVSADIPEIFRSDSQSPEAKRMNRFELAKWLISQENPLTARVIANRTWESLFGVGIVRTSEEFGSQGDLPVNAELLDFLALDLIRSDWNIKRFLRSMLLSEAYKQSSSVDRKRFEEDPENIYVSRGPRLRVAAEQVRDMALSSAGLLSHRFYGPPTRPPQPSMGLNAAFGSRTDWETSQGEDRYRRAIYTQWRRSSPYPSMATFDAPNREVCVLKRDRTNTPLQALVTLNDPVYIEAAQGLARRVVLRELAASSDADRIRRVFQHTLTREPSAKEIEALLKLLQESRSEYQTKIDLATKLATDPIGALPPQADPVELAAWTTLCNVVLNLDEFLMTP